jgi:hypothetical protein
MYDIWLEHNNERKGYNLARDENDQPIWQLGLADPTIPQDAVGDFGYNTEPFSRNTPLAFESWEGGAGLLIEEPGTLQTNRYSHSQGIDLSWGARGYKSPGRTASTDLTAAWVACKFTSDGVFVLVADEVWHWNTGTSVFDAITTTGTTPTDIQEFEGNEYVAMSATAYEYSADGVSWTQSTLTDTDAKFFAVRSGQDGSARLWKITSTGGLSFSDNPVNAGTQWSSEVQIGDTWETVTGMEVAADFIYIFKEEGIYAFDGLIVEDVYPARQLAVPNNGKHTLYWQDGFIYTNYGDRLFQFDPQNRSMRQVFPIPGRQGHPEVNGNITAIDGDGEHIYFALKNAAGNTYIMKGKPSYRADEDSEWHTWTYLGANDVSVISLQRAGAIDASNPVALFGYGTVASYYILPGPGLRPEDDASYVFDTATGSMWGPWIDGGALLHTKALSDGRIIQEGGTSAKYATLAYATNGSSVFFDLTQTDGAGIAVGVPAAPPRFTRIRYKGTLVDSASTTTPVLGGFVFNATPLPMKRQEWTFAVDLGTMQASRSGGISAYDMWELRRHLFAATGQTSLLYDREGRRYVVVVDDVEQGLLTPTGAKDRSVFAVRCFELGVQGYLSTWYGIGSKFLLPDLPDGAIGLNNDTATPGETQLILTPAVASDYAYWKNGEQYHSFIRFLNATIPVGSTIVSCVLKMYLLGVTPGTLDVNLYFEDADSGSAPTTAVAAETLTLTTATTAWSQAVADGDQIFTQFTTADFTSSLQEVIDRAGWDSGNALTFVGREDAVTGNVFSQWLDLSHLFGSKVPELHITYTPPAS